MSPRPTLYPYPPARLIHVCYHHCHPPPFQVSTTHLLGGVRSGSALRALDTRGEGLRARSGVEAVVWVRMEEEAVGAVKVPSRVWEEGSMHAYIHIFCKTILRGAFRLG